MPLADQSLEEGDDRATCEARPLVNPRYVLLVSYWASPGGQLVSNRVGIAIK
jgi:hypothetical protein